MLISLLTNNEIINRASGSRPIISSTDDDSGLFNAGKISPDIQEQLTLLNNIAYKLTIDTQILIQPDLLEGLEEQVITPYLIKYATKIQNKEYPAVKSLILKDIKDDIQKLLGTTGAIIQANSIKVNGNKMSICSISGVCTIVILSGAALARASGYFGGNKTKKQKNKKFYRKFYRKSYKKTYKKTYKKY